MRRCAAVGAAMLAVAGVSACGSTQPSQRTAVAQYIKQVNRIETAMTPSLQQLAGVGGRFAREQGSLLGSSVRPGAVRTAVDHILVQRRRLAALTAPAPAAKLRSLLLELIDRQVTLARQLGRMVAFLPRFDRALGPLTPAMLHLETSLRQSSAYGYAAVAAVYAEKAAALRRFGAVVETALARLRPLRPPDAFRPDYQAQVTSLRGMSDSARRLASALAGGAPGNVQSLLTAFDRAALGARSVQVQKAHIAAVRRYDTAVAELSNLSGAAERERLRLASSLS